MKISWATIFSISILLGVKAGLSTAQSPPSRASSAGAPYLESDEGDATPPPAPKRSAALADAQGEQSRASKVACPKLSVDRSELERGFTYIEGGFDWDNSTWTCIDSALQSPINFPSFQANITYGKMEAKRAATFRLGTASKSLVRTTSAYRIQVEADWQGTNVSIPVCGGNVGCFNRNQSVPTVFYNATVQRITFHTPSDHLVFGLQYPMEAQVMMTISQDDLSSCPSSGCQIGLSVLCTLFDEAEKINRFVDSIVPYIPYSGAGCNGIPDAAGLDVTDFLPSNMSYFTYRGSFTAPPCTEGLTWYVLATPVQVGQQQVIAFQNALAQVQRPCGEGRSSKTSTKKKAVNNNSGKRLLLQSNRNDNSQNSNDAGNTVGCLVTGTRSNNRPVQPLGTRIISYFRDDVNHTAAATA